MKKIDKFLHQFPNVPLAKTINWLVKRGFIELHFTRHGGTWEVRYNRLKRFKTDEIKGAIYESKN